MRYAAALLAVLSSLNASAERPFSVDDALAVKNVSDPRVSPDGAFVAYVVSELDLDEDSRYSNIYMVPMDGGDAVALTTSTKSNNRPRFSPDGRYLAFLSNRSDKSKAKTQIWLLDLRGGEPRKLSSMKGGVSDFAWSPDSLAITLISRDPKPETEDSETEPPLVITRRQFKRDGRGYLDDRRAHLHVVDVATGESRQITDGPYDDASPSWSPDGREIAFVSNRTEEPDGNSNSDIFLVPSGGGEPRQLTTNPGADRSPAWSPDGRWIAHVSTLKPELIWYATDHLAVIPADGGEAQVLSSALDRSVRSPSFTLDSKAIRFLLEDSGNQHLASIPVGGGAVTRVVAGDRDVRSHHAASSGQTALLVSHPQRPPEVFTADLRQLSRTNDALFSEITLGEVENIHFKSKDGTEVEGFVTKPPDFVAGRRYPTILWIHGGPVSQYSTRFNAQWHVFAGAGYVVVSANPRGSSGYGEAFSHAIWADWGNKDYEDVMAAVDHVVELGYSDPERLGVGGWSYGGILTNYVITKTGRFKAATSGASETNYLSAYGTDHYQLQWELELGLPWENAELYNKISPITHVANIVTPTLVLCGEVDWNVPLNQSEQLYQSLKRRGVDTKLIIYPGQSHGIRVPSYQKDRYERYLAWFNRLLRGMEETPKPTPQP